MLQQRTFMIAYVNNGFTALENATIGIGDLAIQRGYGIFDFFRTSNNVPLFLDDYLDRFYHSAQILRLQPEEGREKLKDIIFELIRRNNTPVSGFRMILSGGYSPDSYEPASPNSIVIQSAIELPTEEKYLKGVRIITHEYMRDLPDAKSINYLMGIYLQPKVKRLNADDVLYYKNNFILEFPRSNVFIVTKEGTVVTPAKNVLKGITRMKILELANKSFKVEEREVTKDELMNAAEVFVTSTTKRILPVVNIDGCTVGNGTPGEITKLLYRAFLLMEERLVS